MGRPAEGYRVCALVTDGPGTLCEHRECPRVPGTTTITGLCKNADALAAWANKEGLEGRNFRKTRDDAADAGKIAHDRIDAAITGKAWRLPDGTPEQIATEAETAFKAWEKWARITSMQYRASEVPMVCRKHMFGGTLDVVATVDGQLDLVDWKTSKRVYESYLAQMGAYAYLWELHTGDRINGVHVVRLRRSEGRSGQDYYPRSDLDNGWKAFLYARGLYDMLNILKKAV